MKSISIETRTVGASIETCVCDQAAGRMGMYRISHTRHSRERASQRGIRDKIIAYALEYSELFFRQGMRFYVVAKKNLPGHLDHELREKLNNLVVVMSGDTNEIITCYKANNAMRHIQRKSEYFLN